MKCQSCNKKEAVVHLTEIGDQGTVKIHLCAACAQARGVGEAPPAEKAPASADKADLRCGACGMSLKDFHKKGRLGCGQCYRAFAEAFVPLLSAIHRGDRHVGKVPSAHPPEVAEPDLKSLQESLRTAVEKERFEEAARLSGLIKKLERAQ